MSIKERLKSYLANYDKGFFDSHALRWLHKRDTKLSNDLIKATLFLGPDALPKQRAWHVLNDIWEQPVCRYTGEPVQWQGCRYRDFNGKGSNNSDPEEMERRKEYFRNKYGVDNPAQAVECRNKQQATNLDRYGHTNYLASESGIAQIKAAWADPIKKQNRLDNIKAAFDEKFGGYPYQNPEIFAKAMKNGFKYRPFVMPSGKEINIQGYEDMALEELLASGILEDDIRTAKNEVPAIWYEFEGRTRRYYPDIFVVSQHKIIEVKSSFSYKYELEKNEAKKKACENAGFQFEFRIYSCRK